MNLLRSTMSMNIERHNQVQKAFSESFPEFKKYVIRWNPQFPIKLPQFVSCYNDFCANETSKYKSADERLLLFEELYDQGYEWNYEEFYKFIMTNVSKWIESTDLESELMDYEIFLNFELDKVALKSHLKE